MQLSLKAILIIGAILLASGFGVKKVFFSCCSATTETSGCNPSNCRGAQTKFGEAQVISDLRINLIDLKAELEKSESVTFEPRSYSIHGIIGESDDESISIIATEVKIVEEEIAVKLNHQIAVFKLPEVKAKQIQYLNDRIQFLQKALKTV